MLILYSISVAPHDSYLPRNILLFSGLSSERGSNPTPECGWTILSCFFKFIFNLKKIVFGLAFALSLESQQFGETVTGCCLCDPGLVLVCLLGKTSHLLHRVVLKLR